VGNKLVWPAVAIFCALVIASGIYLGLRNTHLELNLRRGFKRITALLSIIIGLGAWSLCSGLLFSIWDYEREQYNEYRDDYQNIAYFWSVWDVNGWSGGKKGVVEHLLESENSYYGAPFAVGDKTIHLKAYDVFPGIDKDMLNMPLYVLDEKSQVAKKKAVKAIRNNMEMYEYWGKRTSSHIVLLSIVVGLPAGVIGFSVVWFLFFLLRWLVRGFGSDTDETCKKANPSVKTSNS